MKIFNLIFILSLLFPVWANTDGGSEFKNRYPAFRFWLGEEYLLNAENEYTDELSSYYMLNQIAVDNILSDPSSKWKVGHISNYTSWEGFEISPVYQQVQVDRYGNQKNILSQGVYFIYKKEQPDSGHVIIEFGREYKFFQTDYSYILVDYTQVYFSKKYRSIGEEFINELNLYKKQKNIYKNAAIELVRIDSDSMSASNHARFFPNVNDLHFNWDDLILNPQLKELAYQQTEEFIQMSPMYLELGHAFNKGILLAGPPGTGKSFLAQILISSINHGSLKDHSTFIMVTARHLAFRSSVRQLFEIAGALAPSVIFIEDIDLLGIRERDSNNPFDPGGNDDSRDDVLNEFLNNIDGIVDNKQILIVGTTNKESTLDSALLRSGRLGVHLYFGLPKHQERVEFFERYGKKKSHWEEGVSSEWLSGETEGFSGADIIEAIRLTKQFAFDESSFVGEDLFLKRQYFLKAFAMVKNKFQDFIPNKEKKINSYYEQLKLLNLFNRKL